jgi:biotin transport system substrate-specific component
MTPPLALTLSRQLSARHAWLTDLVLISSGSLLVALLAQAALPLPFTPVPLTGQTFAVLLVGAALGARRGAASLALYAIEGAAGLPVFAGGAAGLARLTGPTGGYLVGFIAAAGLVGWLADRGLERRWRTSVLPFLLGTLVIYAFGVSWLAAFTGLPAAVQKGLLPFLPGDLIKLALAALVMPAAWQWVRIFDRS